MRDQVTAIEGSKPALQSLPRRRSRWRIAVGAIVFLVAGLVGLWWYMEWQAERDYQAALAETDRLDPGWRLEDLLAARPAIPDAQNSAKLVANLRGVRGFWLGDTLERQIWERQQNMRLHPSEVATLRKRLATVQADRDEAHKLKDMPDGRHDGDYDPVKIGTSFQWVQDVRGLLNFLRVDAALRVEEGTPDEIMAACRAQVNAARSIGDEPTLIALLVRIACLEVALWDIQRTLAQREYPPEELLKLQTLLGREIDHPRLHVAMRGERAITVQTLDAIRDGRVKGSLLSGGKGPPWRDWLMDWLPVGRAIDRAAYLRTMNEVVEAARLPVEKQEDELARIVAATGHRDAAVAGILPAVHKVAHANARNHARLRCMFTAIAAERYRVEQGFWPASLDAMVAADYLKGVPIDPYDGKAVRYRRIADGVLVYSVGMDREDNGGAFDRNNPMTVGTDIVVQLWERQLRGLPAPAPPVAPDD